MLAMNSPQARTSGWAPVRFRTADRIATSSATEKRHLKRKWKAYITFEDYKSQDRVSIHAPRRQSLSLH